MKPNFNDIKALIEQAEKLKQEVEHLKEKSFLTQVQSKAINAGTDTDTALYLLRLSHTNEEECLSNFGIVDSYFVLTGSVNKGRFAQNLRLPSAVDYGREEPERIEWYDPEKHTGFVLRYDFDEKEFRHFLNQYEAKQRQLYWKNHIQPLIVQLDTDLTPWLPFMKPYIDTERIQKAINTAKAGTLSDAIYEFKKIQKVVETEIKQESAKAQPPSGENAELASTKQNGEPNATPKTDPTLIYQAAAADFYNIPKSTLSKASNKKPGEIGYLWSGRDGKRVFYRKSDCEKLARSRNTLRR